MGNAGRKSSGRLNPIQNAALNIGCNNFVESRPDIDDIFLPSYKAINSHGFGGQKRSDI